MGIAELIWEFNPAEGTVDKENTIRLQISL